MQLFLVPPTPAICEQIVQLHGLYGLTPPPFVDEALVLVTEPSRPTEPPPVVASVCVYEKSPWLWAEWAIGNPGAPAKVLHQAAQILIEAFLARSAARGLMPFCAPRTRSLIRMLERAGFRNSHCPHMVADVPVVAVTGHKPPRVSERSFPDNVQKPEVEDDGDRKPNPVRVSDPDTREARSAGAGAHAQAEVVAHAKRGASRKRRKKA